MSKYYFESDYKKFLLSAPLASDDSDDPDYFVDSSQSQSFSQSSNSSQSQSTSQPSQSSQSSSDSQ